MALDFTDLHILTSTGESPFKSLLTRHFLANSVGGVLFTNQVLLLAGYGDVVYDDKFHTGVTLLPAGED